LEYLENSKSKIKIKNQNQKSKSKIRIKNQNQKIKKGNYLIGVAVWEVGVV